MDEALLNKMADALQAHVRLAYATEIEDAHIPYRRAPMDPRYDVFCTIWREYSDGLFECIRCLVRYERLLTAWTELIGRLDEQVRLNCLADYAHPTLRAAWDIPLTFKDQLAKGIVILEHLAVGDDSMLAYNNHHRGGYYRSELGKLADDTPALEQIQDYLNNDLYSSDEAQHLRDMHGVAFHDTSASPMSGKRTLAKLDDGLNVTIIDKPIDLKTELETIDRQRRRLRRGYELFNERASSLYESLIGQQTPND